MDNFWHDAKNYHKSVRGVTAEVTPHLFDRAWSIDERERKRHRISNPPLAVSIAEATEWLVDDDISSNPIG